MRVQSVLAVLGILTVTVAITPARAEWNDFRGGDRGGFNGEYRGERHREFEHRRPFGYGDRDGYGYGYGPRRFGPPPVIYAPPPFYSPPPYYFAPGY